ncbi:hypothetical protein [Dysgonomonas macrotermitis]|uniref:Uncharacterized protein n=1 Tax=Dysgonomonas macrotermitis TaxID=1346286 RepID=A0A1M5HXB9_9BACT|nr:hypothetical protein [Dysgonomonas macrotermitis]SHG20522.1 hypothetical protein SAMN05444362_11772 [Dysgonomonas macrotermitis]
MAKKKKKHRGHYCRICGEIKSNEAFSGRGHVKHICKECSALPQERKNELQHISQIDRIAGKYPRSRQDWEFLEKMSKNRKYPEAREFAQMILGMSRSQPDTEGDSDDDEPEDWGQEKLTFSEFDEFGRGDIESAIEEDIRDFIFYGYDYPDEKDKLKILKDICKNMAFGNGSEVILNEELKGLFDSILKEIMDDLEKEEAGDLE